MTHLPLTPPQVEGPYYPLCFRQHEDNILWRNTEVQGDKLIVTGHVQNNLGEPIDAAMIELWQADAQGHYRHPLSELKNGVGDPDFQYWGTTITDETGRFEFQTIKPGPYNDDGELRTPHIHFRVYRHREVPALTTQMYFLGEELNNQDVHLAGLTPNEKELLIRPVEGNGKLLRCDFPITLAR